MRKTACVLRGGTLKSPLPSTGGFRKRTAFFSHRLFVMSQHPSLKGSKNVGTKRSVLKRFERVKTLQKRGVWQEGRSPLGLPKTKPDA